MTLKEKIATLPGNVKATTGGDLQQMVEDIYYYFSQMDDFEVLRVEETGEKDKMVLAACLSTMGDPFFKIVVAHTWQTDLAFDNEWSTFEENDEATVFRFLTWEDEYITGEIWFERAKREVQ